MKSRPGCLGRPQGSCPGPPRVSQVPRGPVTGGFSTPSPPDDNYQIRVEEVLENIQILPEGICVNV